MCGIVFAVNNNAQKPVKLTNFIRDALVTSQVRGMDGTGLAIVGGNTKQEKEFPYFFKSSKHASDFIQLSDVKTALTRAGNSDFVIGHVRAATHGKVTNANAHPFRVKRADGSEIIGVHNGTLTSWHRHPDAKSFEVDSLWAMNMIAKHGPTAFEYFDGAYAFVWWDSKTPDKLYVARNDKRSLYFMIDNSKNLMLGASEGAMLAWVAERNGFEPLTEKKLGDYFFYPAEGFLYTFDKKNLTSWTRDALPKFDYYKMPLPEVTTRRASTSGRDYYDDWPEDDGDLWWDAGSARYRHVRDRGSQWNPHGAPYQGYTPRTPRPYGQVDTIRAIEKALDEASKAAAVTSPLEEEEVIVDSEHLDRNLVAAIGKVIGNFEKQEGKVIVDPNTLRNLKPRYTSNPNTSSATRGEQEEAKRKHVYGQMVQFMPIDYAPSEQLLLGEFDLFIRGKWAKAMGELRYDITKARASNLIHGEVPLLVAVVGANDPDHKMLSKPGAEDLTTYVVANLNEQQRAQAQSHFYGRPN